MMYKSMYMLLGSSFTAGTMGFAVLNPYWAWLFLFAIILIAVIALMEYNPPK